ncbi:MAG: 2-oxoacid:acceptor oxidoreductase subunit alpha [Firmicutes bacterium]|nr:2-oxoacid:acceptor oxidoreductase subunit alpha [Bacillota bacterium]
MQGNEACAEGAIAAGANFYAGYPITPATEVAEVLAKRMPEVGGRFIQMEDELACMGAIAGASLVGAKSLTATSGPGFSLMQENLGWASMAEAPCVIVNVQRGGPSTGLPTLAAQGDVMQAKWGTNGDHPVIALSPSTVKEMFDLTIECFNYAEKYRVPVILLTDAVLGHLREEVELPDPAEIKIINRKKPTVPPEEYLPFAGDEDGVPPMANLGEGYRYYVSGTLHDEKGSNAAADTKVAERIIGRLLDKIERNRNDIIRYQAEDVENAEVIVLAYGCVARSARQAVSKARKDGLNVGFFRPITMWPFPDQELLKAVGNAHTVIVPEMNNGQYAGEVARALHDGGKSAKVTRLTEISCNLIHPERILAGIREAANNG